MYITHLKHQRAVTEWKCLVGCHTLIGDAEKQPFGTKPHAVVLVVEIITVFSSRSK